MRPAALAPLLLAVCLGRRSAVAQPAPGDPVEEHLHRGVELRRAGRPDAALAEFDAAYTQRRDARTAAQLGLACQADGRWLRADSLLREALGVPGDPWIVRNRAALEGALGVVGRHLATVDLVGDVPGARVQVNGADVGALPLAAPVRVVAGTVTVVATAEGFDPLTLRFVASAGESLRERVSLLPARVAPPVAVAPVAIAPVAAAPVAAAPVAIAPVAPTPRAPWRALAIGSFVGAAVLVGGGVAALVVGDVATSDYNRQCDPGDARGDCGAVRDRAVAAGATAWTTLPLAALLSIAGTVFVVRDRADPLRRTARATCGASPTSVQCAFAF